MGSEMVSRYDEKKPERIKFGLPCLSTSRLVATFNEQTISAALFYTVCLICYLISLLPIFCSWKFDFEALFAVSYQFHTHTKQM
jgi:hypothetical protein